MTSPGERWRRARIGARAVDVLDPAHPEVTARIIADIEGGTKVYYDRRWRVSTEFAAFLDARPELVRASTLLVLGCGIGLEALAAAPHAERVILNDLSQTAVDLSREQLDRNGLAAHEGLVGRFEDVPLPSFDLAIGSFVVYDDDSRDAMIAFMARTHRPVLLANDAMDAFDDLLHGAGRRIRRLSHPDERPIVWFEGAASAGSPTAPAGLDDPAIS